MTSRTAAPDDGDAAWRRRLTVVIPAYNEAEGISATLSGLREALPEAEILVVDDGSADGTREAALAVEGVRVVAHPVNRGYGGALKTGMRLSRRDYVAWFDADNEHRIEDLVEIVRRLHLEGRAAVIGERRELGRSLVRNVGKWMIRSIGRGLAVRLGRDLNCGLRAFRRDVVVRYLDYLPDAFSASMTSLVILLERGYDVAYHPIRLNARLGESKVRLAHGWHTLLLLLRVVMLFGPLRIFLRGGGGLAAAGVLYGAATAALRGEGVPVLAAVLVLVGVMLVLQGLVADQISQMRLIEIRQRAAASLEATEVRRTTETADAEPGTAG